MRVARDPQHAPLLQVIQGARVVLHLEIAKSKHGPRRTALGFELDQLLEHWACFGVAVVFIEKRAQVPPAFGPIRSYGQRLLVEIDGFVRAVAFTRGIGALG